MRRARAALLVTSLLAGCGFTPLDEMDAIYSRRGDERVLCAANLDSHARNDLDSIAAGLARARARGEVIHLYAHKPGVTLPLARLDAVLTRADALGLTYLTYPELDAPAPAGGGLALSFDDADVASWWAARPIFLAHGARATFFVTRFDLLSAEDRARLHALRTDGHAIEAHGLRHRDGPDYVLEHGLQAYLDDEVLPGLAAMRAEGFTPTVFAYPFGSRSAELDRAILRHVDRVRSVSITLRGPIADPCPR